MFPSELLVPLLLHLHLVLSEGKVKFVRKLNAAKWKYLLETSTCDI